MDRLILLYITLCMLPFVCKSVNQASFYGGSFIKMPQKEARSTTDVRLKFRTQLPNGLLLLTAGATDYCVIYLESGSLKIKINLGAGESELSSPQGLVLNDLKWHEVLLKRKEANTSLLIDNVHSVQKRLTGNFFELNIDFGLFIGGKGSFSELFLGHLESFRGCIAELEYNGMYPLEKARKRLDQAQVHGVTWNCAAEFEVDAGKEISFVEDGAYVTVSHTPRSSFRWYMEFKTNIEQCIFLYSTKFSSKLDILALEIWNSRLRLTLKLNNININLTNEMPVSDGRWHKVKLQIGSTVELIVDSTPKIMYLSRTSSRRLQFSDVFSIGGIEIEKRSRAMAKGLKTSDINFKGCVKNIIADDYKFGLSNVKATEGIRPGCIWQYPCLKHPCAEDSVCIQKEIDSYQCKCKGLSCVISDTTKEYKVSTNATDLELLLVKTLQLVEGENVLITTANLHVVLDYYKYGIRDSGIIFHVAKLPAHGTLHIDIWPRKENSFTMLDLSRDKVHYVHDGSETTKDEIVMELELSSGEPFILPSYLQGKNSFTVPIIITPGNDPPILDIPTSTVLRIAQGAEEIITNKILQVKDPDSTVEELIYNVLPEVKNPVGHFERLGEPGVALTSFSQQDIDNKQIKFVHHGSTQNISNIALQVSDGIGSSNIAFLRVSAFAQHIRLQNNTGVMLVHMSSVLLTSYNLSFVSNVKSVIDNVKFSIVSQPHYGVIEMEQYDKSGTWNVVEYFTSDEMNQNRVRYRHINGSPTHDEFKFLSSLRNVNSTIYSFRMTFTKLNLIALKGKSMILKKETALFSNDYILYATEPLWTNPSLIQYHIIKSTLYGKIMLYSKHHLKLGSTFLQEDVNLHNIKYQLLRRPYSNITDSAIFVVSAPGCNNVTANVSFMYYVTSEVSSKVHVILKALDVAEGSSVNITSSNLNLKIEGVANFIFNITHKPKYGTVQVVNEIQRKFRNNTNYFTLLELLNSECVYIHDDAENTQDKFTFLALSNDEENAQYVGELSVNILLKNDNSPVRSVDKILNVVTNGEKLITGNDLAYIDADINTKSSDIVYSCREIPNGALYRVKAPNEKIFEFTQEDLDTKVILFKHQGDSYGKIKFWISDGHFNVNGYLEVQASTPFIQIFTPVKVTLEQNKSFHILPEHLRIVTNLNTKDENIVYEIIDKPQHGQITFVNKKKELQRFTHHDIVNKNIIYTHDGTSTFDAINLKVHYETVSNMLTISFRVLPASYWKPLLLVGEATLIVEESTSIIIMKENLEVLQYQVPANVITYHVREPPQCGYLDIDIGTKNTNNIADKLFTQEAITTNRVRYVQSSANATKDRIVFNITNGVIWLNNVVLYIIVIPEYLYLGSAPLNVREGADVVLTTKNLFIMTEYYKNRVSDYVIIKFPKYGCLKKNNQCITVNNFSQKILDKEILKYFHDGTENLKDEISVVAIAGQKRSLSVIINIHIQPVNDQKPIVINNTGLIMWEGGVAEITNEMLSTTDNDEPKGTLTYVVKGCWWGNVTLKTKSEYSVQTFTQEDIDKGLLLFKHANGSETKFVFTVSDGVHTSKEKSFKIVTKPVTLSLVRLSDLHVFPLHRTFLTVKDLLAITSDPSRTTRFEVTRSPNLGRIMMETETPGNFKIVRTFSQVHINETKIFYEHTHPFSGLYANDSFTFNIQADLATTIYKKKMQVDISVSSGGLDSYITVPKVEVIEGGLTSIHLNLSEVVTFLESHTGISAPIIHISCAQPSHGYVYLTENANASVFTQAQIEQAHVKYQHDHSDSLNDSVHLSLYLIPGYINLCNVTLHIKINPINDQPFKLVTVAPRIIVVQGENYTISRNDLLTEDADTEPADLQYDIITGPGHGKLIFLSNSSNDPKQISIVNKFTQADIDARRLMYVHYDDSLQTTFYFRIWDGKFKPDYTLFSIQIIPVLINVKIGTPVYLQQGSNVASLSVDQFVIHTNANKNRIHFTLTQAPFHGIIYVKDIPSNNFVYTDLYDKSVMYMQTDMASANDTFKVFVGISSEKKNIGSITDVIVTVQPLMQIGNISFVSGSKIKLTLNVLDATPLAKLTSSNPKYVLTQNPLYGEVRKIIRSSGEKRNVIDNSVSNFTHEEIKSGLIYYMIRNVNPNWKEVEEKIVFLLSASIFQPAIGEFRFRIWPGSINTSKLSEPRDPAGREGEMHTASPNISTDYFLILTVILGIVVCGITIIIIIKCRHVNCKKKDTQGECEQPIQLPKPPDQLMPVSPYMKRYMSENISVPTAATSVPQCKVTLLRPVDSLDADAEMHVHARYPYGASDDPTEDWSSYDTSDPTYSTHNTNLMLRKNQYWV